MSPRNAVAVLASVAASTVAACSLLIDTDGYTGGPSDAGVGASLDAPADGPPDARVAAACDRWGGLKRTAYWPTRGGCLTRAGRTSLLGPASPHLVWTVDADAATYAPPTVDEDGTVYFGNELRTKSTLAVRPDGTVKWARVTGNVSNAITIAADGTLYASAGSPEAGLNALAGDGTVKWVVPAPDEVDSCPAVVADGTVFYGSFASVKDAAAPGWAFAVYPDGGQRWALELAGEGSTPAVGADGTLYFVGGQKLYALTPDGGTKWSVDVASDCSSPVLGAADTVHVACGDGSVRAFGADGALHWTYATNGLNVHGPAVAADGTVYVGSSDEGLHAIRPDGTRAWIYRASTAVGAPLISGDGTLYVGGDDGTVHAVNPDGTKKWTFLVTGSVTAQPALAADGTLYVVSRTGFLHALAP